MQNLEYVEEDQRAVAWEVVGRLAVSTLLQDCVDALMEAYLLDDELYQKDKAIVENDDGGELSMPMLAYVQAIMKGEAQDTDDTTT